MAFCCSEGILDLGCAGGCDTISTGLTASASGDYTIIWEGYFATVPLLIGQSISFENPFNEDMVTVFQIKNPAGSYVLGSGGQNCFQISITISIDVTDEGIESGGEV